MIRSTSQDMRRERILRGNWWVVLAVFTVICVIAMLCYSHSNHRVGFPLDDAWIHQTYARNLEDIGKFSFQNGVVSAGSTSPLWTIILVAGYWLKIPFTWTYIMGGGFLLGVGILGEMSYRILTGRDELIPWFGLFLIGEWHLLWAAGSGMETIFFIFLEFLLIYLLVIPKPKWILFAMITGALVWTRPDGITWLGPIVLIAIFIPTMKIKARALLVFWGLFALFLLMYGIFNYQLGGSFFPNTYSAKQMEYSSILNDPLTNRYIQLFSSVWIGAGIFFLPGYLFIFIEIVRVFLKKAPDLYDPIWKNRFILLALSLWALGYILLYALRLPVTYQHGRYIMPAIPVFYLLGAVGINRLLSKGYFSRNSGGIISRVYIISGVLVWLGFIGLGIRTYAEDVAIINTEMVDTAIWIENNLPMDALIAVHDIGAIGYYSSHTIIDLAGLVSPEVIPFLRDEEILAMYLTTISADYLVVFPGWYSHLPQNLEIIYQSKGLHSPEAGGENMTVYAYPGVAK